MSTEITEILKDMVLSIFAALVLVVPLHELGHFIGGVISGYRFTSITLFRVCIYDDYGKLKITRHTDGPIGQCLMHPKCIRQNPVMLIAGGIAMNIMIGMIFLIIGITAADLKVMVSCVCFGGINLAMGLMNAMPDSPTNDGSTLIDATRSNVRSEIYNRIMLVYRQLETGHRYKELSEDILEGPDIYDSTLAAELALYRYYRIRDLYSEDKNNQNLIRIEMLKLTRYAPGTGVMEAMEHA